MERIGGREGDREREGGRGKEGREEQGENSFKRFKS